jgi:dCMP deaminase
MKKDDIKLDEGYETFSEGPKFEFPREIFSLTKESEDLLKDNTIIADGYNGTPSGFENDCEVATYHPDGSFQGYQTKWYVLHAESNALAKVAKSTQSCDGATLYVTCSPCTECSKLIIQSGIKKVVYLEEYRDVSGLDFLRRAGIELKKIEINND